MMPHAKSLLFIHTWERNFSSIVACVHHYLERCKRAKLLLSRLTLCDPMDCILPDSSVHGIFHARILEWVAISLPWGSSRHKDHTWVPCVAGSFLHCRWILYGLSHQGIPYIYIHIYIHISIHTYMCVCVCIVVVKYI